MKKLIWLVAMLIMFASNAFAANHEEKPPMTKIETFLSNKGRMFDKDIYPVGGIREKGWVVFSALVVSDPTAKAPKIKGMSVEMMSPVARTAFMDIEELENLSKALEHIIHVSSEWNEQEKRFHKEIVYTTNGYLQFGCKKRISEEPEMFVSVGISMVSADLKQMADVKKYIDNALLILNRKSE